jgi:hypothetical protein
MNYDSPVMVEQGPMTSDPWGWPTDLYGPCGFDMDAERTFAPFAGQESVFDTMRHHDPFRVPNPSSWMPGQPSYTSDHGTEHPAFHHEWSKTAQSHEARPQTSKKLPTSHISPAEWAAHRSEITDLYRHRGWTLPRVMQEMAKRGFRAS